MNDLTPKRPETSSTSAERPETTSQPTTPRRRRAHRKRTRFKAPPRPARAVKHLWESASAEERERAHKTCMDILEYWMGKQTKGQVAEELGVPPLRVWQLSQQALSGMLAGLLKQPKRRKVEPWEGPPDQSPAALKKRVAALEKTLARTEDLVRVLRMAPWVQGASEAAPRRRTHVAKTRAKRTKARRARGAPTARAAAPSPPALEGGAGDAG